MDLVIVDWVSRLMTVETEIRILQVELGIQQFERTAGRKEPVHSQQSEFTQRLAVLEREQERIEARLGEPQIRQSTSPSKYRSRDAERSSMPVTSRLLHLQATPVKRGD